MKSIFLPWDEVLIAAEAVPFRHYSSVLSAVLLSPFKNNNHRVKENSSMYKADKSRPYFPLAFPSQCFANLRDALQRYGSNCEDMSKAASTEDTGTVPNMQAHRSCSVFGDHECWEYAMKPCRFNILMRFPLREQGLVIPLTWTFPESSTCVLHG